MYSYFCVLFQLVSNAIQFLASVCERPHYKNLFEDQNTLTSICEKVIVPNMEFRGNYGKMERALRGVKVILQSVQSGDLGMIPSFLSCFNGV